jgi:hypothetical protein
MIRLLIMLLVRRAGFYRYCITSWETGKRVARRYECLFHDEYQGGSGRIHSQLRWWQPFNALLHHWRAHDDGQNMHDHPRWSVTICLKGELIELTPWGEKALRPGRIVFRSSRYIHGFRVTPKHSSRTWTLFIVGRRRRCQNTYVVTRRTETPVR